MEAGGAYRHLLPAGRTLTALAIRGNGSWNENDGDQNRHSFQHKDFMLLTTDTDKEVTLQAGDETLRMIIIEAPTEVDYPLYRK
jgi:redox-sensitive bicupin YhaK (pirin superfamily)